MCVAIPPFPNILFFQTNFDQLKKIKGLFNKLIENICKYGRIVLGGLLKTKDTNKP